MAQRRERGIYKFATPPSDYGILAAKYRLLLERGDYDTIQRSIRWWDVTQHEPYFPFLETDLSPLALYICTRAAEPIPEGIDKWMMRDIEDYTPRLLTQCGIIYNHIGKETILREYCPVAWASASNPSRKELLAITQRIVEVSGRQSIPYYYIAVSDESMINYGISMPVVWMRRSFLETFNTGISKLNIYRMMGEKITKIYDIPAYREEE